MLIKSIEHNKVEIERLVEQESPRTIGLNERKKNLYLQKVINTGVIDDEIGQWLQLTDSIILQSP